MDARQAARNLEVIRTLMERTCQYQLLTARAGLMAGSLAAAGSLLFLVVDAGDPRAFGGVWVAVFACSLLVTALTTISRSRRRGEKAWSHPARAVLWALTPSLFAAVVLSIWLFAVGLHLWLPGVWMLCYGQGALATSAYAPSPIRWLGIGVLLCAGFTLWMGPDWAVVMMGLVFGAGHIGLGAVLLVSEQREGAIRLHRSVA
jgi:hypothetical protein